MHRFKLLAALAALAAAGVTQAADRGEFQLTPFAGYSRLRVDQSHLVEGDTQRLDQLLGGVTLGYRLPVGLVFELGKSNAVHDNWFDSNDGFVLDQGFATVGWQIDFAPGWRITPKFGRTRWSLESEDTLLLDNAGVEHKTIRGYDNYGEVSLMRSVSDSIALGINFKDVDTDFGHTRSGAFIVSIGF